MTINANANATMTPYEIVYKVRLHLLKQMEKSLQSRGTEEDGTIGSFAYRGVDGMKCPMGCLILDEFYSPELESLGIAHPKVREALLKSGVDADRDFEVLAKLQDIHDHRIPCSWAYELNNMRFGAAEDPS